MARKAPVLGTRPWLCIAPHICFSCLLSPAFTTHSEQPVGNGTDINKIKQIRGYLKYVGFHQWGCPIAGWFLLGKIPWKWMMTGTLMTWDTSIVQHTVSSQPDISPDPLGFHTRLGWCPASCELLPPWRAADVTVGAWWKHAERHIQPRLSDYTTRMVIFSIPTIISIIRIRIIDPKIWGFP